MQFKVWLENRITREEARNIVLDAVEASGLAEDQRQAVLGSKIGEQPRLVNNIRKYSELAPYMDAIDSFIRTNPQANLITLIDFIDKVDTQVVSKQGRM